MRKYRINISFDNAHKHEEYIYSIAINLTSTDLKKMLYLHNTKYW